MNKNDREESQLLKDSQYLQDESSSEADADAGEDEWMDGEPDFRDHRRGKYRQVRLYVRFGNSL